MRSLLILVMAAFFAAPALAQENLTFGHENKTINRYKTIKVPGNARVVIINNRDNKPKIKCAPNREFIGKSYHVLDPIKFDRPVRIIGPEADYTTEHNPDRLNFFLDSDGVIQAVTCG